MYEPKNYTKPLPIRFFGALFALLLLSQITPIVLWAQNTTNSQPRPTDQIIAQVNDRVILKSDIDTDVRTYILQNRSYGQNIPFSEALWFSFLENSVENFILLEKAKIDSVIIPDDRVNRAMDQRIQQLIMQAGSEQALERAFGKPVIQLREEFREDFREQMTTEQVRQTYLSGVTITRPEVAEFFESIPKDSLPTIPEQVALSQIVIIPPAKSDAKEAARFFAESLRDSILVHGIPLEDLARRHSDGPSGPRGGLLPLMGLNELVSEYSAAAAALTPGQISEVVETEYGYHVIELIKRIGDQIETRHILISVNAEELDDDVAIERLISIRDSLVEIPDLEFSSLARTKSQDPITKVTGGKVLDPETGERYIPLNRLDANLYRTVLLLENVGDISEPRAFTLNSPQGARAYRIIRLDERIEEHVANMDQDFERLRNIALQQKQLREYTQWVEELREEVYIEYRIDLPSASLSPQF
jgi:peptidyl-prolyl cis-trans isomerase SurA